MAVTADSTLSVAKIRYVAIILGTLFGLAFYLYGPPVTPALQAAAVAGCNDLTGGNFRSYELHWVIGADPHWSCIDRSDPASGAVNMGWWVTPGG